MSSLAVTVPRLLSHDEEVTCDKFLFLIRTRREYGPVGKVLRVLSLNPHNLVKKLVPQCTFVIPAQEEPWDSPASQSV